MKYTKEYILSLIRTFVGKAVQYLLSPPLIISCVIWSIISIFLTILTQDNRRLGEIVPGAFGVGFNYITGWIWITLLEIIIVSIVYVWHKQNHKYLVITTYILVFLQLSYLLALWPEIDSVLKFKS